MLALKELLSSKLRFALMALAIALVVSLTILMSAMSEGLVSGMTGAKGSLRADALVFQADTQLELERSLLSPPSVAKVQAAPGVERAYRVGHAMVSIDAGGKAFDARLFGVGAQWEQLPSVEGAAGPPAPGQAIADVTAKAEGLYVGQVIRLSPTGRPLEIVGFTKDRRYVMAPAFYVDMITWEEIHVATALGQPSGDAAGEPGFTGSASVVAVDLAEGMTPQDLASQLGDEFEVAVPQEAALAGNGMPAMVLAVEGIQIFSLVLGALVIGIFFYITTIHKTGQMAAIKALGASNGYLYRQLLLQIGFLVTAAVGFGTLLALAAGASMPPTMAFDPELEGWAVTVLGVYLMAFLGSLFSLRSILAVDPASALSRNEQ